jgi:acyl-CoA synthetase (AMP-forming)/AMP-acid ligase II
MSLVGGLFNAPMNLGDLLNCAAVRTPSKTALIFGSESLSYKALDQSATLLAQWFVQSGLRKEDRVAIHWSNSFQTVQLFFACFRAGLIAVPINTRLKAAEIAYILDHSRAMMCFSQPELESIAREAATKCPSLHLHTQVPELSEAGMPGLPDVDADEPALIIYTSGTTARPKGVTHTHRTLICTAEGMASVGVDGSQTVLVLTTMMHASGLTVTCYRRSSVEPLPCWRLLLNPASCWISSSGTAAALLSGFRLSSMISWRNRREDRGTSVPCGSSIVEVTPFRQAFRSDFKRSLEFPCWSLSE